MTIDQSTLFAPGDAQSLANDIAAVSEDLSRSLDDSATIALSPAIDKAVTENQAQAMRERAQRERVRGTKQLAKRHEGVASIIRAVVLDERPIGSAFIRWFGAIEGGIYVAHKHGARMLGDDANTVVETINKMVEKLEADATEALKNLQLKLQVAELAVPNSVPLTYAQPAASVEVQLRHPLCVRVVKVFEMYDEVIAGMVKLEWSGEIKPVYREQVENNCKKGLRELATFLSRTLKSFSRKLPAPAAAQPANATAAQATPEPAMQEAA